MNEQAQLDLFAPRPAPVPAGEIDRLLAFLAGRTGWTTAKEISAAIGLTDRQIRQLARDHRGSILSGPGSPGYKLIADATLDEINHTADRLRSQAREMLAGSIRLRKVAHSILK
jgi:hypothetical protein